MKITARLAAAAAAAMLAIGCQSLGTASPQPRHGISASQTPARTPASPSPRDRSESHKLRAVHDPGEVTGSLTGTCHARDHGRLPDPTCTPGAYDPAITAAILCAAGYHTSSYRPPESQTEAFKFDHAYPAYGISDGTKSELDHLVPLELGGANDAANLWPEVGSLPNPKDAVEGALHDAVCSGQVSLRAAQRAIAADWMTAEAKLGIG